MTAISLFDGRSKGILEAVLDMMSEKKLNVNPLISIDFLLKAEHAYDLIFSSDPSLGVLLEYKNQNFSKEEKSFLFRQRKKSMREFRCELYWLW